MRLTFIIIYFFSFLANSHEYNKNEVIIDHPIIKVSSADSKIGAGYFKVINNSNEHLYLREIVASISTKIEIHEVIKQNDIYKMRPIKNDLLISPGESLVFKAKSYHAMFFNFNRILENNEMIKAKINFRNNLVIPVEFKIIIGQVNNSHH
ncbi:MAG: hypothetical protein CFH34_01557 [Alphaproteobacteria bacterium MarineAlpha9_Bin4]|nr:hypothetical protein [Pelagibacterales bacterium]PPR25169.1 MAG: hypothetical protein CFH34_01557 [Alphaproteobacteria bacterium MarineAlpha9_Bin4]|tara:strand:+ start:1422 stop:1874 length:453 start_codon:yes stop_codon:yes gene_type:complete